MPEPDDITLLKRFAGGDESAFTWLFERHVHLVYSAALRQARNPSHAEEVTQTVFILLARKAKSLSPQTILSGWLYQAARLTTASLIKREIRRLRREQEVYMQTSTEPEPPLWEQISPWLDEAMGRLGEQDRNAIVLRFFENRTPQEVAVALRLNEVTARKRVSRAMEKLRAFFAKRGVVSTAAIMAGTISDNSIQAAPAALANPATAVAIAKGAVASTSTLTLIKGALKIMAWSKTQTAIVVGVGVLLAVGSTILTVKEIQEHRTYPWQIEVFNRAVLDQATPQVRILSAKHPQTSGGWGMSQGKILGLGAPAKNVIQAAYASSYGTKHLTRITSMTPLPAGSFDFIASLPKGNGLVLQQEIKRRFGVTAKLETTLTDVFVITVKSASASGLRASANSFAKTNFKPGDWKLVNTPISVLAQMLEDELQIPVIDRTGLTGDFDCELQWDEADFQRRNPKALQQAVLDQLGLELARANIPVEMLVVEKAN
ncbi:MAG TPA: TIGR03435 family protein [Verrucomicrobiae bacterium]|jgi:uncharacterized protein (TIGR03435 family)|nr:TIGR03435 family protein [Verrucomicrobiae bacterium]